MKTHEPMIRDEDAVRAQEELDDLVAQFSRARARQAARVQALKAQTREAERLLAVYDRLGPSGLAETDPRVVSGDGGIQ